MRLPVPGPRDLLGVLERSTGAVEQLLAAVPRMVGLLDEVERVLARVDGLVDRIDNTRAVADAVVNRTETVLTDADKLVATATLLLDRLRQLLDITEPSLQRLQPTLERLAETTDPKEVDALVAMVDLLPVIATQLETQVIPVMTTLATVSPDLHDLLDASRELNEMLAKLPGLGKVKRRVEAQQASEGRG